jgi:hypothetical protein
MGGTGKGKGFGMAGWRSLGWQAKPGNGRLILAQMFLFWKGDSQGVYSTSCRSKSFDALEFQVVDGCNEIESE